MLAGVRAELRTDAVQILVIGPWAQVPARRVFGLRQSRPAIVRWLEYPDAKPPGLAGFYRFVSPSDALGQGDVRSGPFLAAVLAGARLA